MNIWRWTPDQWLTWQNLATVDPLGASILLEAPPIKWVGFQSGGPAVERRTPAAKAPEITRRYLRLVARRRDLHASPVKSAVLAWEARGICPILAREITREAVRLRFTLER